MKYNTFYKWNEDRTKIFVENQWLDVGTPNPFNLKVSFLVLDFNKPQETLNLLSSIRSGVQFKDYEIVLLSNGGQQDYAYYFYKQGLVDRLFLYKDNLGCGIATHDLFNAAKAPYSIYVQNDHVLSREFTEEELQKMIQDLNTEYDLIDLSGGAGHNDKYSERAHIIKTDLYKSLPIKGFGGPGPYENWLWSEAGASYSFWNFNHKICHNWPMLFGNTGYRTVREVKKGITVERYYI